MEISRWIKCWIRTGMLCALMTGLQAACGSKGAAGENGGEGNGQGAPVPPSPYTLSINLNISDQGSDMDAQQLAGVLPQSSFQEEMFVGANHLKAAAYAAVVNVNIGTHLLLPVALLRGAASVTPVLTAENTWTWSYTVNDTSRTWTANLTGQKLSETAYSWQMRVSSNPEDSLGCCTDFLLFDGQSSSTGSGSWQLYDPARPTQPGKNAKLYAVVYDYKSANGKTLAFTVNSDKPAAERFGQTSRVTYVISGDLISLRVFDSSEGAERLIEWNRVTRAGSQKDLQGNQVCWTGSDAGLADRDCQ